ncbi:hypothetical protein Back11_36720 [Paenibacillus baekrokdamisoli]|uniref:Uncharacterized protein n=1 Tax=Paenibacillus baekrokdamisoli TaxID=1712516 RepID=A0A3G9ITX1_9BACL|nr:LytTR family DNA-binding domain-containing protein [Paenibacillus baekrokdamisoli]MBB3072621.1 DNA-binding LytR/AlgR family response regulator [Paenibacillus baekrokdamisoli]BBH22327.1 hypothetical protein Back11_36720 [Paenibacillus baekrokdamisoli]
MYLPIKSLDGSYKVLKLNEDILLLQTDGKGRLCFHTFEGEYRAVERVGDWEYYLRQMGFLRTDRGTIVNLHKVEHFDPVLKVLVLLTFNGPLTIPVADSALGLLNKELDKIKSFKP